MVPSLYTIIILDVFVYSLRIQIVSIFYLPVVVNFTLKIYTSCNYTIKEKLPLPTYSITIVPLSTTILLDYLLSSLTLFDLVLPV